MIRRTFSLSQVLFRIIFLTLCSASTVLANSTSPLTERDGHYLLTYDHLTLPQQEKMGLAGVSYMLDSGDYFSFGLGVYGAVYGERGGFFTGGFEGGLHYPFLSKLYLDSGLFVGGGGGGAAPQGGGLMIRPHLRVGIRHGRHTALGLGISRVWFPNGEIISDQMSFHIKRSFSTLYTPGHYGEAHETGSKRGLSTTRRLFAPQLNAYFPDKGTPGRGVPVLDSRMDVVGIRWRENLSGNWWGDFETGGAWGGGVDGFAQVFIGAGYEFPILPTVSLISGIQVGAAGGGDVHTGGGLLGRMNLAALFNIYRQWQLVLEGGRIQTLDGRFEAWALTTGLAYQYSIVRSETGSKAKNFLINQLQWADFRFRAGVQRYARYFDGNGRKSSSLGHVPVDQVYLKIDSFANDYLFFTGQALAAYAGEAGGYAVGLVGSGVQIPLVQRTYASFEMLLGAAGGGGIAVGGGMIAQPMMALGWQLDKAWGIEVQAGYIRALAGELKGLVLDMGLSYEFSVPHSNL